VTALDVAERASPLRSSPLSLTVLFMLAGGPLHPYEMQRRMKLWGKDLVVNLSQRAGLYKTIERLRDARLIAVVATERDQRFPERTVYELTDAGFQVGRAWLKDMLANPRNEFPRFPAALSFIFGLTPEEALAVLEQRLSSLRSFVGQLEMDLSGGDGPAPPRVTLLETEYLVAVATAEVRWLKTIVDDLRNGKLTWRGEELREAAERFLADNPTR
jgi:DNA-binding PadR family transcriptional regulator